VINIAHIVNPVAAEPDSRFHFIQQVTFQTMQMAREVAQDQVEVDFLSAQYAEDHDLIPSDFIMTSDLNRSVVDVGTFTQPRKLPLINDILERGFAATHAEYLIFTNMDIGLQPYFYKAIRLFIQMGYDAFTINRRTISDRYTSIEEIPLMYSEIGEPHPGWDCFVFRRELVPQFHLGTICVGAPLIGLVLIANLIAYANNFQLLTAEHLTFHLGDDRAWNRGARKEYALHNRREALHLLRTIEQRVRPFPRQSPPNSYLAFHRSKVISFLYDDVWLKVNNSMNIARKTKRL
jgi:hypothetical protein